MLLLSPCTQATPTLLQDRPPTSMLDSYGSKGIRIGQRHSSAEHPPEVDAGGVAILVTGLPAEADAEHTEREDAVQFVEEVVVQFVEARCLEQSVKFEDLDGLPPR